MQEKIHVVIPVPKLHEAETHYADIPQIVGFYLEAVSPFADSSSWENFYDKVALTLPEAGELEDYYYDQKNNRIENFELLEDQLVVAMQEIKESLSDDFLPLKQYEVLESKKYGNDSVVVTLIKNK